MRSRAAASTSPAASGPGAAASEATTATAAAAAPPTTPKHLRRHRGAGRPAALQQDRLTCNQQRAGASTWFAFVLGPCFHSDPLRLARRTAGSLSGDGQLRASATNLRRRRWHVAAVAATAAAAAQTTAARTAAAAADAIGVAGSEHALLIGCVEPWAVHHRTASQQDGRTLGGDRRRLPAWRQTALPQVILPRHN
eukprot:357166-Chlamydomonas_euryale.AAC.7